MKVTKAIQSEFLKLKYPPILWLIGFIVFVVLAIVFSAHYIDINNSITLGRNPWTRLNKTGQAIFSIFIATPFVVLLLSSALFVEYKNHGFKQFYTLPKSRAWLIIYKIIALILSLVFTIGLLIIGLICAGYLLNFIYPETEFIYFSLPLLEMVKSFGYTFVSLLGIIGIQFFLSLRFKGFLVSASFGVLAYVVGLILGSINNSLSLYFPYCYPIIGRENGMFDTSELNIDQHVFFNEVELLSIVVFLIFIGLSLYTERKKNI